MKLLSGLFLTLLFLTFSVVPTFSADKAVPAKQRQVTGDVTALDIPARTITVTKKSKKVVLNFEEKTDFIQCTNAEISDIKIGDKVTAKYSETSRENTARSVTIRKTTD
jgi:Cu/Ag efflux protein CusF